MIQRDPETIRILVLSDLHFTAKPKSLMERLSHYLSKYKGPDTRRNISRLFDFLVRLKKEELHDCPLDHVIVLGDLTRNGLADEFKVARNDLLELQERLFELECARSTKLEVIDTERFTIIPGNHDLHGSLRDGLHYLTGFFRWWCGRGPSKKKVHERMARLLKEFDEHFGHTISDEDKWPSKSPEMFGQVEKLVSGTNIRLVPLNSCAPYPPLNFGINAVGYIDTTQLSNLSELGIKDGTDPSTQPFRIVLTHHSLLPVPLNEGLEERFMDIKDANRVLARLFVTGSFSACLAGHRHHDFVWANSDAVPGSEQSIPVITVGTTTDRQPHQDHRCCLLELEDRQKDLCSVGTTFLTVRYFECRHGGIREHPAGRFCREPRGYRSFVSDTAKFVQNCQARQQSFLRFLDFSRPTAKILFQPHHGNGDLSKLEFSRWGTRIYGDTNNKPEGIDVLVEGLAHQDQVEVILSCRTTKGTAEISLDCTKLVRKRRGFTRVEKEETKIPLTLKRLEEEARVTLSFRSTAFAEVVLHYLSVSSR